MTGLRFRIATFCKWLRPVSMKFCVCLFLAVQCAAQGTSQKLPKQSLLERYRIVIDESSEGYGTDIYVIDGNGEHVRKLTKDHDSRTPSWSPDGRQILFLRETAPTTGTSKRAEVDTARTGVPVEVWRMDVKAKKPTRVATIGPDVLDVLWIPDGEHIAIRVSNRRNPPVFVDQPGHLATNSGQPLSPDQFAREYQAAAADLAWQRPLLIEYFPPADNFLPVIHATWLSPQIFLDNFGGFVGKAPLLPDQEATFWEFVRKAPLVQDQDATLKIVDLEGHAAPPDSLPFDTAWSPSGDRISYSTFTGDRDAALHVTGFPKQENTDPLAIQAGLNPLEPVWSPDGSRIAFIGLWKDGSYLFVIDADGSHGTQISHYSNMYCLHPSWSPDGRWIVAECRRTVIGSGYLPGLYPLYHSDIVRFDVAHPSAEPHYLTCCACSSESPEVAGQALVSDSYRFPCGAHHPSFMPVPQTKGSPAHQ